MQNYNHAKPVASCAEKKNCCKMRKATGKANITFLWESH